MSFLSEQIKGEGMFEAISIHISESQAVPGSGGEAS